MKKILALMLAVIMLASVLALPVMAEDSALVLTEDFGKVKIQGKVQSNGSIAFAVRSAFGENETQDIIQYFVSPRGQETGYGMESNQAFDFYPYQELVSKTSSTIFSDGTKGGGDERTPVNLSGFGWIGAGHGMTCAVTVIGEHGLTYKNIGDIYIDINKREWVLLRVTEANAGTSSDVDMQPALVFISKELMKGNDTNPTFHSFAADKNRGYLALDGTDLVNVNDETNKVTISKYKNSAWLRPAYNMTKQNVYAVNNGEKTLITADGQTHEADYVLVEEEYTIMNPVYVAQTIINNRPEGGYTENPNLAVGEELVTFKLEYIYNPDGTVISNWETTYHQDAEIGVWGGIQYGNKGDFVYLPNTKPFVANSSISISGVKTEAENVSFDFTNLFDTKTGYPNSDITTDRWADASYAPHRRLDFNKTSGVFDKAFVGGQLPVFDNVNSERIQNADKTFYMWNTRKAYFHSASGKINTRYPDLTGKTLKGSAYKKWISDFDANGTASYYSVPYFSDGDNSRYMYFDLYQPGATKKYDISAYLGTYSISELEKTENLEYSIDYTNGILTVSSKENNQTSADSLVLKAKYVGESVTAVEMKMRALPELYDVSINDKLTEIADLMESIGAPEDDYAPELIAKYNSLLAQKAAYEQAIKDEAANADRVAGLDNRYENIELYLFEDVFATDSDFTTAGWYENKNYVVYKTGKTDNILAMKGFESSSSSKGYPQGKNSLAFRADALNQVDNLKNGIFTTANGIPFTLGTIQTESGKMGANAFVPRAMYNAADYYTGSTPANTMSTSIYTTDSSFQVNKAQWPVNKSGISTINMLMTGLVAGSANRFYDTYVKYEGETTEEHHYAIAGMLDKSFEGSIKLITKEEYTRINEADEYAASMTKLSDMTVNDLNALTGYTPDASVTVDTSKKISPKNYTTAEFNAATGFNITTSEINTSWNQCTGIKELYNTLYSNSKYQRMLNESKPVTLESRSANLDLSKITSAYTDVNVALPADSTEFVPAGKFTTSKSNDINTYVANTAIAVNPEKTVESIRLEANMTDPASMILGSGGFYSISEYNVQTGMLMLNYDGQPTVTIDNIEYVMFLTVQRECGDSMLLSMNVANQTTWQDKIDALNGKMLALSTASSTYDDVQAVREEIKALLAQNTSIVYIKDFSEEARTNIDNVEAALKATAEEQERVENLSKNVFTHIDMNKYGKDDVYVTAEDYYKTSTNNKAEFGVNNTLTALLPFCTVQEKTAENGTVYKEYYTADNYLFAVLDVAKDTYYYNGMGTSHDKDAYPFLDVNYQYKYVAGTTKLYYYKSGGTEKTSTGSQGSLYLWYHNGAYAYKEKSPLAQNKTIVFNTKLIDGDSILADLTDITKYSAIDKVSGNEIEGSKGVLTSASGTKFEMGPFMPSDTASNNGIMLDTNVLTLPFGETGVYADYINILANTFMTEDTNTNTSFWKVEVNYEDENGTAGKKLFGLILPKSFSEKVNDVYITRNATMQEVMNYSIYKVAKNKAQASYDNIWSNKETTTDISVDDITINTKVPGSILYPTELVQVGKAGSTHSWWSNTHENYAGVYKLPVADLHKVTSVTITANGGGNKYVDNENSTLYVEGAYSNGRSKVAVPVTVEGGDENYNYYGIYSPTWATRSVLYAINTEKLPASDKIAAIEAKMAVATEKDVEEIEGLIENLTADGAVVYPKDFNSAAVEAYEKVKEAMDVSATVETAKTDTKVTVKAVINNTAKLAGKKFTVITVFYDANKNVIATKINPFETTAETEITKNVVITDIPDGAASVKAFVWKDLMTLKPLADN